MSNFETMTVRDIAINNPVTTRVFEEFKIDYCCGGHKSLREAMDQAGADANVVVARLSQLEAREVPKDADAFDRLSLGDLITHIETTHHVFTRSEIAALTPLMEKVVSRHGDTHPELPRVRDIFARLCADLLPHLEKEEVILFPYVRHLELTHNQQARRQSSCFGTVKNPVKMMMLEHDTAGDLLREMRAASMEYELPSGACPSYTALYSRLADFEKDLHQHIHLENNLLFPRAVELEDKLNELG